MNFGLEMGAYLDAGLYNSAERFPYRFGMCPKSKQSRKFCYICLTIALSILGIFFLTAFAYMASSESKKPKEIENNHYEAPEKFTADIESSFGGNIKADYGIIRDPSGNNSIPATERVIKKRHVIPHLPSMKIYNMKKDEYYNVPNGEDLSYILNLTKQPPAPVYVDFTVHRKSEEEYAKTVNPQLLNFLHQNNLRNVSVYQFNATLTTDPNDRDTMYYLIIPLNPK